jgi:hypothetical protein
MKKTIVLLFPFIVLLGWNIAFANGAEVVTSPTPVLPDGSAKGSTGSAPVAPPVLSNPIKIVHPAENAKLPALAATFVCGSVPADGKLTLNGQPVPIHPDGGFVAMVNLAPGEFGIKAELTVGTVTYQVTRTVYVAAPEQPAPVTPLTIEYVLPKEDQELLPGDALTVVCKGSPGMRGYFTITGGRRKFPLRESQAGMAGIYQGVYQEKRPSGKRRGCYRPSRMIGR